MLFDHSLPGEGRIILVRKRVEAAMAKRGLSQTTLAAKADVAQGSVSNMINERPVLIASAWAVSEALGTDIEYLTGYKETRLAKARCYKELARVIHVRERHLRTFIIDYQPSFQAEKGRVHFDEAARGVMTQRLKRDLADEENVWSLESDFILAFHPSEGLWGLLVTDAIRQSDALLDAFLATVHKLAVDCPEKLPSAGDRIDEVLEPLKLFQKSLPPLPPETLSDSPKETPPDVFPGDGSP